MHDITMTLLLSWFPIVLAVAVAGRVLGRSRNTILGILCSVFWLLIVLAAGRDELLTSPWTVVALGAGVATIILIGQWSGVSFAERDAPVTVEPSHVPESNVEPSLRQFSSVLDRFTEWLEEYRSDPHPWAKFDELLRAMLYEYCGATHVKPFRLPADGDDLVPLRDYDPFSDSDRCSSRSGIIGHVVTTGRSFIAGLPNQGEMVEQLAERSEQGISWCFAIRRGAQRLGVVTVGQLGIAPEESADYLRAFEKLVVRFWCSVDEACRGRTAAQTDPASGLATRSVFLRLADETLQESFALAEPVAVVVIALEGLRDLNDSGRWEIADDLIREVGGVLQRKVRLDDRLGRFDGSRMVVLLRRVDSDLASLIVRQMITRVGDLCSDESRWGHRITVRCGITGSGTDQPSLRTLVSRALTQCTRARQEGKVVASDLDEPVLQTCSGTTS